MLGHWEGNVPQRNPGVSASPGGATHRFQSRLDCSGGCLSPSVPTSKGYSCEDTLGEATLKVHLSLELSCLLGGSLEKLLGGALE